jgi:hypothetical protein
VPTSDLRGGGASSCGGPGAAGLWLQLERSAMTRIGSGQCSAGVRVMLTRSLSGPGRRPARRARVPLWTRSTRNAREPLELENEERVTVTVRCHGAPPPGRARLG